MRVSGAGIFLIGMLLLVSSAEAAVPHHMTITGDDWMIADDMDTSPITVMVLDANNFPVSGAQVTFQVESSWELTTQTGSTGSTGTAATTLDRTKTSGTALVTVTAQKIEDSQMVTIQDTYLQKIDHTRPLTLTPLYDGEVTVGSIVPISVILSDLYGNPCDNRRLPETLTFSSSSLEPAFWDGNSYQASMEVPTNESGIAAVSFRVDRVGANYVIVRGPDPIPALTVSITGIADGFPTSIQQWVMPGGNPYPSVIADGSSKFLLTYILYDRFGFPAGNRQIDFTTSIPAEGTIRKTTNSDGVVQFEYGPKLAVGLFAVTAVAVDSPIVTSTQTLEFVSGEPVAMMLTANPQSMASRDWSDTITSTVMARVVDVKGNPVQGQTVTFRLTQVDTGSYLVTRDPAIESGSTYVEDLDVDIAVPTGVDGIARVTFHPGAFSTDRSNPLWSSAAGGAATVQATWSGVPKTIQMAWKNYPYLSVETAVPDRVFRNGEADIMVRIRGDGWALQPDPIDVVLVTDRSGSMLYDDPDRMYSVREAAKLFVEEMEKSSSNAVGLVSFGRNGYISRPGYNSGISLSEIDNTYQYPTTYSDYATLDRPLGTDLDAVKLDLERMVPDYATPMRRGLKVAIEEMMANHRQETVQAIVLLSDGDYNYYGDPLARGAGSWTSPTLYSSPQLSYYPFSGLGTGPQSNQNMSQYAHSHGIRIYTIAYGTQVTSTGREALRRLAETSGGKYFEASSSNINDVYIAIAGELRNEAGIGTSMDLDFNNVEVNTEIPPIAEVFEYVHYDLKSTKIHSYIDSETNVVNDTVIDQTDDWTADHTLHFSIGTIQLNQVWEANYTLKVLKEGQIRIFDSASTIRFNNGQVVNLPDTYLTVLSEEGEPLIGRELHLMGLRVTTPDPILEYATLEWDLSYTGTR
ncbi:MAG: VWA domain-containing protein, partial [Methanomicrobiales archaeon]|nr:VWA domain-containing protein [Methanomicrobiales archaeon]